MILLTGATGFVGREVLRQAGLARLPIRALLRTPEALAGASEVRVLSDLTQPIPPAYFAECHAVIHCAARAHVMHETSTDPESSFLRANCELALSVAEAAAQAGVRRFVFVSSIKVLGEETAPGHPYLPNDVPAPLDAYGRSKAAAERELRAVASRTGIELVIVRPPLVHGVGARGNLAALIRLVRRGFPLPFGSIQNRRSLVHVTNLAELLLTASAHPKAAGHTFHVSDGAPISTRAMIESIASGLHRSPRLMRVPVSWLRLIGRVSGQEGAFSRLLDSLEVDATATTRLLNWQPRISTVAGLHQMAEAVHK